MPGGLAPARHRERGRAQEAGPLPRARRPQSVAAHGNPSRLEHAARIDMPLAWNLLRTSSLSFFAVSQFTDLLSSSKSVQKALRGPFWHAGPVRKPPNRGRMPHSQGSMKRDLGFCCKVSTSKMPKSTEGCQKLVFAAHGTTETCAPVDVPRATVRRRARDRRLPPGFSRPMPSRLGFDGEPHKCFT